jgi:hypothetical protein
MRNVPCWLYRHRHCRVHATVVSSRSRFEDKFGQVVELYKESDNSAIRRKDFEGGGLASFRLLDNVQTYDDSYDKGDESFDEYKP